MGPPLTLDLRFLKPDELDALSRFWRASFPLHPLSDFLLRERIFNPHDYSPERALISLGSGGEIVALSLLSPPPSAKTDHALGGLRWFGVHPAHRGRGLGTALLTESCARLQAEGAEAVDFLTTPPFYIQPGIDVRLTEAIAWLLRRGFEHVATHFNMTCDLAGWNAPPEEKIFSADENGYRIRRAEDSDREPFGQYCERQWTANWRAEASQGFDHDPVSLFLAVKDEDDGTQRTVGFACYECNQCLGCFGPTGVDPADQGHGLGKRLLWATLLDMKRLGRKSSEIGWVGPVDFYSRACGATLGPVFWQLRKKL